MNDDEVAQNGEPIIGRLEVKRTEGDPPVTALKGELDLATVPMAEQGLEAVREDDHVVLDLRELRFMDSSGLRLILNLAEDGPAKLTIVRGPDQVNRVFELTGAAARLDLVDDPSQANSA